MDVAFLIVLVVVATVAYRVTTPEDRKRYLALALDSFKELKDAASRPRPEIDGFRSALRARMSLVLVTPAIALVMTFVFVRVFFGGGATSDPDTLLGWGASLGTRTTNGEWWRLLTAMFVHAGMLHFIVDLAVLIQLGLILERLVGRLTLAVVFLSAGVLACMLDLSAHPVVVMISPSGAIFGLYGLLIAALIWQQFHTWRKQPETNPQELLALGDSQELIAPIDPQEPVASDVTIPLLALRRLAIGAGVFMVYSAFSGHAGAAEFTGMLVGLMYGVVLARRAKEHAPRAREVAYVAGPLLAVIVIAAIVIGGVTDVKPELSRVVALEDSTSAAYQAELAALKKGRVTPDAVAELAEKTIVAELEAADARLQALKNVPPEHRSAVADAREYVRLRSDSWRARSATIRRSYAEQPRKPEGADDTAWRIQLQERFRSDAVARANAEGSERASREAFARLVKFLATLRA